MKLVTYRTGTGNQQPGALVGNEVVDLSAVATSMLALIAGGESLLAQARRQIESDSSARHRVDDVTLLAPVPQPGKIICLAGNYAEHVREGGMAVIPKEEQSPWLFMKPATTVIGPGQPVQLPNRFSNQIDWECELGVVIGKVAKDISEEDALDSVAGYTVFNDISARSIDHAPQHHKRERDPFHDWLHGKWFDTFGPMGPCLVTRDEIPNPQSLALELRLNGEVRQHASTADMVFSVAEIVAFVSAFLTLEPGDLISTGTPSGIGKPSGRFLKPGDVLEAEIEHIGILRTPIAQAAR